MRHKLYPTITPVNTFRLLLTECFEFDDPLVPDRNFMDHQGTLTTFAEITDKVPEGTPERGLRLPEPAPGTDRVP